MDEEEFDQSEATLPRKRQTENGPAKRFEGYPESGQMLGERFLIERELSQHDGADKGGFGLIYLAKDMKLLDKLVVIKVLRSQALNNPDIARKFKHEREALIRLDHPNIVKILDSGALSDGSPYMVMEYIEGQSLEKRLAEGGDVTLEFCAHVIESVTNALAAAHSSKVLHRDIKPANIMLTPRDGEPDFVRLIDFGIARVEESKLAPATQTERGIGTVFYVAPEQLLGSLEQTPGIDIYSTAVVAYRMLSGKLPFNPKTTVEMFELQKHGVQINPRTLRPDISSEAERLILSGLEFDPNKRPKEIQTFGKSLAGALRSSDPLPSTVADLTGLEPTSVSPAITAPTEASIENSAETPAKIDKNFAVPAVSGFDTPGSGKPNGFGRIAAWIGLGAVLLSAIGALIGFAWWQSYGDPVPVGDSKPKTSLTYYLEVQKMRNGRPFETPFKSSGQEVFENGYKFKALVSSAEDGHLYLFNEDQEDEGSRFYNILYPTPSRNGGAADVEKDQEIETGQNTFGGKKGTEIVWLIWTREENDILEDARRNAYQSEGKVKGEKERDALTQFIEDHAKNRASGEKDTKNQKTIVSGSGGIVIHKMELEHR